MLAFLALLKITSIFHVYIWAVSVWFTTFLVVKHWIQDQSNTSTSEQWTYLNLYELEIFLMNVRNTCLRETNSYLTSATVHKTGVTSALTTVVRLTVFHNLPLWLLRLLLSFITVAQLGTVVVVVPQLAMPLWYPFYTIYTFCNYSFTNKTRKVIVIQSWCSNPKKTKKQKVTVYRVS